MHSLPFSMRMSLWCLGLLFAVPLAGFSQGIDDPGTTGNKPSNAFLGDSLLFGTDLDAVPDISLLFADNLSAADKKKIQDYASAMNESVGYSATTLEDLMNPAADLYGEDSWTGSVNPFGGRQVKVPNDYSIDVRDFIYPLDGLRRVNSKYGYRGRFRRMHYGIDLQLHVGDTVRSCFDGKVRIVDYNRGGYGKYVVVRHTNGLETVYGHMSKQLVKEGDIVHAGDPVGLGGSTGRSTGPHLHLEMRFLGIALNPSGIVDFGTGIPVKEKYVYNSRTYKRNAKQSALAASKKPKKEAAGSAIKVVKIRKGDTLSKIAKKNGVTVSQLCKLNGISTRTKLRIGSTLRVSS